MMDDGQLIYLYLLHLNIDQLNADSVYYQPRFTIVRKRRQSLRALSIDNLVLRKTFWSKTFVAKIDAKFTRKN